jgi:hypothetical protein
VVGYKYVRLYAPDQAPNMHACPASTLTTNTSTVDLFALPPPAAEARWPGFPTAPFQDVVLGPGRMLYIPPGWWHAVLALQPSFSVSFWWR